VLDLDLDDDDDDDDCHLLLLFIAMLSRVAIKLIPIDDFTTSRYVVCPGAVESRIEKRREEMAAGTFKDEPQDMLDMMLPSLQWGDTTSCWLNSLKSKRKPFLL